MMIERLVKKGIPRWRIWVVVDTVTHLQNRLMTEARQINVKNPDARDVRRDYVRDATTEVDFNINLTHMSEVANFLSPLPCNVIVNALSREEFVERKKTGRVLPAITGQSATRFNGDADAILYLNRNEKGERWIECNEETGGDRSGRLSAREPADLWSIMRKMIGRELNKTEETPATEAHAQVDAPALPSETTESEADASTSSS